MTDKAATALRKDWETNSRWKGIKRPYKAEDVVRLRGNVQVEHTLARLGAEHVAARPVGHEGQPPLFVADPDQRR